MYQYHYPHPAVTTDVALFSIHGQELTLLLVRRNNDPYKDFWALPGGFVNMDEDLETCAMRELQEETGITSVPLEQLHIFSKPDRDPRERVISVAYYALVPRAGMSLRAGSDARDVAWFSMSVPPRLAFDHATIVDLARQRLVDRIDSPAIVRPFLPTRFTLDELRGIHEIVAGRSIDKRRFRKRALACMEIEDTGETRPGHGHRPERLYTMTKRVTKETVKYTGISGDHR